MSVPRRYRVALVGCGDIAETGHLPALLAHPRFELAALCDSRAERAQLLSVRSGGVPVFTDYRELLERTDLDAAVLALHPEISVDVAIAFLRQGKAVLDEKPLARSMEDGRRLAREIESLKGVYQLGFVFRYSEQILTLAKLAQRIGAPHVCRVCVSDERLDRANTAHFARIQQCLKNASAITHEGSHILDFYSLWNPAPPRCVHAWAAATQADFNGPNLWHAQYSAADGSALNVEIVWFLPELPSTRVELTGPRGWLHLDPRSGQGELHSAGCAPEKIFTPPLVQNWRGQLDAFAGAIDCGESRAATVYHGLRALAATKAAELSWKEGRTVDVEQIA